MSNDDDWEEKIAFATMHFDVFCGYIQDVWLSDDEEGPDFTIPRMTNLISRRYIPKT